MNCPLTVLYGSQTGNAQDVAERVGREAKLLLFSPRVVPMDAYDVLGLPSESLAIFIVSTTGQGEFPANAQRFWKFLLRKSLPPDSLAGLRYAVFGLGDSGYPQYNVAAKKLDRRLAGLGAQPLVQRGLGDDQHVSGYEAGLDRWLPDMWSQLRAAVPLPPGTQQPVLDESAVLQLGEPKFKVTLLPGAGTSSACSSAGEHGAAGGAAAGAEHRRAGGALEAAAVAAAFRRVAAQASGMSLDPQGGTPSSSAQHLAPRYGPWSPFPAPVLVNRRITSPTHFQDVRHMELGLQGSGMEGYTPGDLLCVWPRPDASMVDAFLTRMGLDGEQTVQVEAAEVAPGQPAEVARGSVRAFVEGVLDVAGASPRRRFFQVLWHHTPEAAEMERERLQYFASAEGRDDLYTYNQREGRTVLEVLQDFRSCSLPLTWLLEACPLMRPRQFSIASSARMHPGEAHLTVAVVEWTSPYKRKRHGLCSTYLASRRAVGVTQLLTAPPPGAAMASDGVDGAGDVVAVWVEPGCLRMPPSLEVPLILVGPGTGIAPFRSFLEERAALLRLFQEASQRQQQGSHDPAGAAATPDQEPAACCLFFGCRSMHADCYYLDQWRSYQQEGVLLQQPHGLSVAASRDQEAKVYVTHKLREHGVALWDLISKGAAVYVSGSAQKMPSDVAAAFQDLAASFGGLSQEAAQQYIRQMELKGRYRVEAWS